MVGNKQKMKVEWVWTSIRCYLITFRPVRTYNIRYNRVIARYLRKKGWKVFYVDIKSSYLNGELRLYMYCPMELVIHGKEDKVYLLKMTLHSLKR